MGMRFTDQEAIDITNRCEGNIAEAARQLEVSRQTLASRLKKLNYERPHEVRDRQHSETGKATTEEFTKPSVSIDHDSGIGWIRAIVTERPADWNDLLREAKLDPTEWTIEKISIKAKSYQGFYASGPRASRSHTVVPLEAEEVSLQLKRVATAPVLKAAEIIASRGKALPRPQRRKAQRKAVCPADERMAVFGLYDAHIGALAWDGECDENNDTGKARRRCIDAIDDLTDRLRASGVRKLYVPVGNDLMHFDNLEGYTTSGRVQTDFDTRYANVVIACHDVLAHMMDRALEFCDELEIVLVGGNHDRLTSFHMACWLEQRYRNDDRVSVDKAMRPRKYRKWNNVLLMFAHGDRLNVKDLYRHFAEEGREHWSSVQCREAHFGDKHHEKAGDFITEDSYGRITFRQNPSISPRDRWTVHMGFDAVRAAQAHIYCPHGLYTIENTYAQTQEAK